MHWHRFTSAQLAVVTAFFMFALSITGVWWNSRTMNDKIVEAQRQDRANFITLCNMYRQSSARGIPVAVLQERFHDALTHGPYRLKSARARFYAARLADSATRLAVAHAASAGIQCHRRMPNPDEIGVTATKGTR